MAPPPLSLAATASGAAALPLPRGPGEAPPPLPLAATASGAAALPLPRGPGEAPLLCRPLRSSGCSPASRRSRVAPARLHSSRNCNVYHQRPSRRCRDAAGLARCSQVKVETEVDDETCELVNGVELVIGAGDESIRAYLMKAVKNNNGAGILLLSDIFGFEDSCTREFAYRVACSGYNVLVPDLFRGNPWRKGQPAAELDHWLTRQLPERVADDIAASTRWMVDEFVAAGISNKLGVIGFCFGGRHMIQTLAQDEHGAFGAGICIYGSNMNPSIASSVKVPVLFVCGDDDPLCHVSVVREMEKSIKDSKVVVYEGRGHGFAHRPESQEEDEDAEDAFVVIRTWLHDHLIAN